MPVMPDGVVIVVSCLLGAAGALSGLAVRAWLAGRK